MRVYKEDAFVLRTIPFTESSLIVDAFTRNYGRVNLMAKGARRQKSRTRSILQPFQLISLSWSGKGEVPTIIDATITAVIQAPKGEAFYGASHLNELLVQYLHAYDAHPVLFDAYLLAVEQIMNNANLTVTLRIFEKKLLAELGYALILETEGDGLTPIKKDRNYDYDFDKGPVPTNAAGKDSVTGRTLLALAQETLETRQTRQESRKLLDRAFRWHFQRRTLRSREVYRQTLQPILMESEKSATSSGE